MLLRSLSLFLLSFNAYALSEREHQDAWCKSQSNFIQTEYRVKGGRVDCLTESHAIEFGFANKWKEDIAQARWYALQTGKRPGIVMIFKKPSDKKYLNYLREYLSGYDIYIRVWTLKDY